jgi:hypothetical protein
VSVVDRVMDRDMTVLEWSSGSSTIWSLKRALRVYSVEHCESWVKELTHIVKKNLPDRYDRWTIAHVPCVDVVPGGCDGPCSQKNRNYEKANYTNYVTYPRTHFTRDEPGGFDFISVDGRWRPACMLEVLENRLLRDNGFLLLDNADRTWYHKAALKVPPHWVQISTRAWGEETSLWLQCTKDDIYCQRAQMEINEDMLRLSSDTIGTVWKKLHGG